MLDAYFRLFHKQVLFCCLCVFVCVWYAITVEITYGFNDNDFLHETPFILMTIFMRPVAGLSEWLSHN